jgi:ABC-type spermidine/putrescine transport system permease subunit II
VKNNFLEKAFVALVTAVCVLPLLGIIVLSVTNGSSQHPWRFHGFNLDSYMALPSFNEAHEALLSSLTLAIPVALIAGAAGFLFALCWWIGLSRKWLLIVLFAAACMPADIHALALVAVYKMLGGTRGAWWLLQMAMVTFCLPFATAIVVASLSLLPKQLLEAASDLGGSSLVTIRTVILPLAFTSVLSAALISALLCLNEFGRTFYLSGGSEYLSEFLKGRFEAGLDPRAYSLAAMMALTAAVLWGFVVFGWQRTARRSGDRAK